MLLYIISSLTHSYQTDNAPEAAFGRYFVALGDKFFKLV